MVLATLTVALAVGAACQASSPAHTQALVELYTSQGCSSCPPADRWLSRFDPRATAGAVPLALHVGYWDYIGWKDPYARREFNARQEWLAELNRNRTVYTPGVFLQAREMPRWSEGATFDSALRTIAAKPARAKIDLAVESVQAGAVQVNARAELAGESGSANARLFVALTESGIDTPVKAGENRGVTLHNDHVTRDWSGPLALGAQKVALTAPATAGAQRAVVAFVQDLATGDVLQALRLPLAACTP
ncbi:MAG TPA: DUF1223 domain-containing protein [Burkholderiaceae bacterium]|nr:DUF1223 domain-containing protein [Burkholderiaceae bacterium]